VEQLAWTGAPHAQLIPRLVTVLRAWRPRCVVVDATGMGQPVAGMLKHEYGARVTPFVFTERSKSDLGYEFLSLINGGRIRLYAQDGSREYAQTLQQLERARAVYRPNRSMTFHVEASEGHDDLLMSLALLSIAVRDSSPRVAKGGERADHLYEPKNLTPAWRTAVQRPLFTF
jgi:hypothetical protein